MIYNTNFQDDENRDRVAQLESVIVHLKKQIGELEVAKNEAAGEIAAAKMEVYAC